MKDPSAVRDFLRGSPPFAGILFGGLLGAVAGFAIGLVAYAPTAWAAAIELGIPAALVGGVVAGAGAWILGLRRRGC